MTTTEHAPPVECVVLLHGLGRTAASMIWLANDLRHAGYLVVNQGYPSRKLPIPELSLYVKQAVLHCQALAPSMKQNAHPLRINFVTHSMGAILLRSYFANPNFSAPEQISFHRAVLLGPPNQGSEIVDQLKERWYFKLANGPAGTSLGTAVDGYLSTLPGLPLHFGVIAGVAAKQNWLLPKLPMPHDGKVTVASTHLAGQAAHLQLPIKHTWLPSDAKVRKHVIFFLRSGIFRDETGKTD
jgi:triacylglycerol lipase